MNKLIAVALSSLFAAGVALAQTPAAAPAKPATPPATAPAKAAPAKTAAPAPKAAHVDCETKAAKDKHGVPLKGDQRALAIWNCNNYYNPEVNRGKKPPPHRKFAPPKKETAPTVRKLSESQKKQVYQR